jgi:CRISPR/Cas system CMR subunit Cmr4 (Cas7 group RAMP superfamily)
MKKILILPVPRLFIDRVSGKPISRFKYTSMTYKEIKYGNSCVFYSVLIKICCYRKIGSLKMELPKINKSTRLAMNSTVALTHYSLLAANNNTVCALITKDQRNQKEKVNKLLSLERKKFEEKIQLSEEEEYQNKYNKLFGKDQEIEKGDESKKKIENIQKEDVSGKSIRESQKNITGELSVLIIRGIQRQMVHRLCLFPSRISV